MLLDPINVPANRAVCCGSVCQSSMRTRISAETSGRKGIVSVGAVEGDRKKPGELGVTTR
jgi:hypothetical protein